MRGVPDRWVALVLCAGAAAVLSLAYAVNQWQVHRSKQQQVKCESTEMGTWVTGRCFDMPNPWHGCDPAKVRWLDFDGTNYVCDPQTKKWVIDQETAREIEEERRHKRDLAFALRSRIVTDAEMQEVLDFGPRLFYPDNQTFREEDAQREFSAAMMRQFLLRTMGQKGAKK